MNNFLFLGYGYVAKQLVQVLSDDKYRFIGTSRTFFHDDNVECILFDDIIKISPDITHVLISIPPKAEGDIAFLKFSEHLKKLKNIKWIGYLSTTGVYGDTKGAWVNEDSEINPMNPSSTNRVIAEEQWLSLLDLPVNVYRLPGIYGKGRSIVEDVKSGNLNQIIHKDQQVFSRMHVEDIAVTLATSIANKDSRKIYNLADDLPASSFDVAKYVLDLLRIKHPPVVEFDKADLSEMARRFYSECRRVDNSKIKLELGIKLKYPTYKEGMKAIIDSYT